MSFVDIPLLIVVGAMLIVTLNIADFVYNEAMPDASEIPEPVHTALDRSWTNTKTFYNNSFAAIFIIAGLAAVLLTAYLYSSPVALAVWLLFNMVSLFIYDAVTEYLSSFLASSLNTNAMIDAVAFWNSGVPLLIPGLSLAMAIIMFGRTVLIGSSNQGMIS